MKVRFVMLRKSDRPDAWEHEGAQEVEVDEDGYAEDGDGSLMLPESKAVAQLGLAGVFVAIPFKDWVLFEAEAQVTVRQVATVAPPEAGAPIPAGRVEDVSLDDDMEGMTQGPKR